MATVPFNPFVTYTTSSGTPLVGGKIYAYVAGTTTPKDTYTDATGTTPATNPIILDANGRSPYGAVWLSGSYKLVLKDSTDATIQTDDNITATFGAGDMSKAVYDPANISQQVVGTTAVQTISNKTATALAFSPGTISQPPYALQGGSNLTTAQAGATEYDGKVQYFTPVGLQRGIVQSAQEYIVAGAIVGANVSTAQSALGVSCTLSSSTVYEFEGAYYLSKTAGVTTHTMSTLFGGTATLAFIGYDVVAGFNVTSFTSPSTATTVSYIQTNAATALTATSASASQFYVIKVRGVVYVTTGGTFTPQYQLSAAPGGAYTTGINSYFKIWPVGAIGSAINVGTWA